MSGDHGGPVTIVGLWRLARPGGMPLVLALPLVGYVYGHWEYGLDNRHVPAFLAVVLGWFWLSAGTLWLNACLDRDDGEVLMGPRTPVPAGLRPYALGALTVAVVIASTAGPVPGLGAASCAVLAVAYSWPGVAWKGHAVLGPLVNVLGYGLVSPLVGWWVVDVPATWRGLVTLVLLVGWVAATYVGAQAFQEDEDRARGYRTLVAEKGARFTIGVARGLYLASVGGLLAAAAIGLYPRALWASAPALVALDAHLARWQAEPSLGAAAGREMLRRAAILAVVVITAAVGQHVWDILHGLPPAGRGTSLRW